MALKSLNTYRVDITVTDYQTGQPLRKEEGEELNATDGAARYRCSEAFTKLLKAQRFAGNKAGRADLKMWNGKGWDAVGGSMSYGFQPDDD